MEDINEDGTVQYWLEVHRLGSVLFENIKSGDNTLKTLITSFIESPLLSDIECLTDDSLQNEISSNTVAPFTSWLLEGLLKATACHTLGHLKTFYTASQSRLLIFTYERDLYAFQRLTTYYVEGLGKIIRANAFPFKFKFILQDDYSLDKYDKILPMTLFQIKNFNEQLDYIITFIEVIKSVLNLIIQHCPDIHSLLWRNFMVLLNFNFKGINFSVLLLLSELFKSEELSFNEDVLKHIFQLLCGLIEDPSLLENPTNQRGICELWNSIRENYSVNSICNREFISDILKSSAFKNKKCSVIKSFLINELSNLISEVFSGEDGFKFLGEYPDLSFNDKMYLLFHCTVNELRAFIDKENWLQNKYNTQEYQNSKKILRAFEISRTWTFITSSQNFLLDDSNPTTSKFRLDGISNLLKFCWKILHTLDTQLKISRHGVMIYFFGKTFNQITEKILSDLQVCQNEKTLQIAAETLSCLLNLPEAQSKDSELSKNCLNFLMKPFKSGSFELPGFGNLPLNSVIPALFLQCLQTLPLGASAESCILIYSQCASLGDYNKDLTVQAIKSTPFLFLSRKTWPSRLISDILLPVVLQDNKEFMGVLIDSVMDLICALAGTGTIIRDKEFQLHVDCSENTSVCTPTRTEGDLPLVESHLVKLICQFSLEDPYIKKKFLKKLPHMAMHMTYLTNKTLLEKFLPFLSDPDEETRHLFSNCLPKILYCGSQFALNASDEMAGDDTGSKKARNKKMCSELSAALELIFGKLEELIHHSFRSKDFAGMQRTLLETLINIASFPDDRVLSKSIRLLLLFIGQPNVPLPAIFSEIAAAHKITPLLLYYTFRPEISHIFHVSLCLANGVWVMREKSFNSCGEAALSLNETMMGDRWHVYSLMLKGEIKSIIRIIISLCLDDDKKCDGGINQFLGNLIALSRIRYKQSLRTTVSEVIAVFKGLTECRFITGSEGYIIPVLILWIIRYRDIEDLLEDWSSLAGQPLPLVLSRCFQNIYTYILLNESSETFEKCMFCVERLSDLKLSELILHSQKFVVNLLLFNYHRANEKVLTALKKVLGIGEDQGKQKIVETLEPRFVGYLLFIVSKFVKEINVDCEQAQAIYSLTSVIELMGKQYVTPVARKVLATLRTTLKLNRKEHLQIQLKSWEVFVQTVEPNELGPLLATIVVSLIPFLEFSPVDISRIFSFLIVKNEEAVKEFLPFLIFIPDHPLLVEVKSKLQKYILFEGENLKERLIRETKLALHETVGVQVEGLKALQKTLKKFSPEMQDLIIGSDELDPCVKTLLEGLIVCCSDSDYSISNLAASCLGQLGAVDPGLLPRRPKPKNNLPLSVHDPEFAFLALTEISRGFQNARNSVDMDAFAIAIQEILKMYQINPTADNRIWYRFPLQIQSLMTPMLSSWYKVQTPKREVWPDILFGSKEANTHIAWGSLWASKLIGYCKDDRAVFLFKVCEPSLKRDAKVLLLFLQYILLKAVIRDSSVHDGVIKEIEAVINYNPRNIKHDDFRLQSRPIRLVDYCGYPNMRSTITTPEAQNCAMTVFLLIDFLHSWLRIYRSINCSANGDHLQKRDYVIVKDFLEKVDYLKISISNYDIREYPRAIMYLEDVISKSGNLSEYLPILSKAYALYGDLDSVAGASTFQKTAPKIEDLLLSHQVSGQLEEVRIIYEKLGEDGLLSPTDTREMIQCYLNLGEPYTALNSIKSITNEKPDIMSILSEGMAESLIKLGDYSQLEKFLKNNKFSQQGNWFSQIGTLLLSASKGEKNTVSSALLSARLELANSLKLTGLQLGDYQQGYFSLVKMQILNESERVFEILNPSSETEDQSILIKQLTEEWNLRTAIVQSDQRSLEPLLSMRRVLLRLMKEKLPKENEKFLEAEIAKCWVKSAEIARKARCFHQAYNFVLNSEQYNIPLTFIEKAQLFWDKIDQDLCLFTLSRGIREFFPEASEMKNWPPGERLDERKMCAEAKLLYAIYSEETSNCDHNTNMTNYQSAFEVCRQLEKSEAFFAQCLDRVVLHMDNKEQDERKVCDLKVLMVHHFGRSLMYGCEYIYQTVPRMLSVWLDLGEKMNTDERAQAMAKINKIIQGFVGSLPAFVFMTALPQLLSRLGHPNRKVFLLLKDILILLVKAFPQQFLWAVQAVAKSSVSERVQRYNEFIQDPSLRSSGLFKLISDFTNLCDKLNKLTNRNLPQETAFRGLKVSSIVRELPQLLASEKFSAIIIPITRFCSIALPRNVTSSSHEPFPKQAVYIVGIEDDVTVLQSLQRPRKISFRGSDGKYYDILCKPKDDLRRDGRLMEFNNIVNMYLRRDPESRHRGLHIRTYVVTPLGESGGLLEWVPNLIGLRQSLIKLYKQFGKYTNTREIKRYECHVRDSLEKKRSVFVEKLLVLHPPLFPEWFRLTFPDPSGWYIARESYVRTTAVMSMVGYILGLGDRHGENILFDSESGDTVHVDFNCLFNKGEKFDWKERVPFRLTHNMVAAMGPFGVEGTFRKSCEISLRVLRSQTKTLMSVLTPFAYDPFGSWGKNKEIVQNERDQKIGEAFNELSDIEQRLNGSLRVKQKQSTVYLSVEGQARSLIVEATDIDNLCQMYFGWGAYL